MRSQLVSLGGDREVGDACASEENMGGCSDAHSDADGSQCRE